MAAISTRLNPPLRLQEIVTVASLVTALRASKASQALAAGAAIVVIGAGGWAGYRAWGPDGTPGVAANEQIVPVQRGDLVSSVSVNGSLSFPDRETLTFGNAGTVTSVSVTAGQLVKAGDELARLDTATIANLEAAVAQARVNARNAAEALALAQAPDPVKLAQARVEAQSAQDALDALRRPSDLTMAQAESAVAGARLALQNAENARANLLAANSAVELETALSNAEKSLQNATDSLAVTRTAWDAKLPALRTARDSALDAYRGALSKYAGIDTSSSPAPQDPDTLLAALGIDLTKAYASVRALDFYDGDILPDDPATAWNETTIFLWKSFFPGSVLVTCDSGVIPQGGVCISSELDKSWSQYQTARDTLAAQENQAAVAIAAAQASVDKARDTRNEAKEAADTGGPDAVELAVQDQNVAVARARLDDAERALADLKVPDALQVALKQAQLAAARDALETLENGDPVTLELLQSNVNSSKAAFETAQSRLSGAVLVAPWDGQVSAVNIAPGQAVTANLGAVEIVDPTRVQLSGTLDEIDVLYVQPGARAQVTLDALGGQAIQGTVATISTQGTSQQGVVTFPVTIDVTAPQGVQLREGLSATATVVLNQESNVLLIPSQAVAGTFAQPVVHVLKGDEVKEQPVTLGNSDGFWVAVTDGLAEGDRVVMAGSQTTSSQLNTRGLGGLGALGGPTFFAGPGGSGAGPVIRQEFDQQGRNQGQGGQQSGGQRTGR